MTDENSRRGDIAVALQIAPLIFVFADRFFKFLSWALLLSLLSFVIRGSENGWVRALGYFSYSVYGLALMSSTLELMVRDYSTLKVPRGAIIFVRVVALVIGLVLWLLISSPLPIVDEIIAVIGMATRPAPPS